MEKIGEGEMQLTKNEKWPCTDKTEKIIRNSLSQKRMLALLNFKFSIAPMTQSVQDNEILEAYQRLENDITAIIKLEAVIQEIP